MTSNIVNSCQNNLDSTSEFLFLTLINALFAAKCPIGSQTPYPEDYGPKLRDEEMFDFIIVGSGSAGSVVANKLTENGQYRVLVLEAGGYPSSTSDIPSLLFSTLGTNEDWRYETEPSTESCLDIKEGRCNWSQGKVLGGSSSINAMLYLKGNKRDYDQWAAMGNTGWDWDGVAPHFKSLENMKSEKLLNTSRYGRDGYLSLTYYDSGEPVKVAIQAAGEELGYPGLLYEQPLQPLGYLNAPLSIDGGLRQNSAKSFIGKVKERKNLYLSLQTHVRKIIIDDVTKEAKGVEVQIGDRLLKIYCKKEVIVSAGSIGSPKLLMLSGIGPDDHLKTVGIKPIVNLPVGRNLQDHMFFPGLFVKVLENGGESINEKQILETFFQYFMFKTGELADISITNLVSFVNTKNDSVYPNIQFHHILYKHGDNYLLNEMIRALEFNASTRSMLDAARENVVVTICPTLINPKSRGRILLRSNDPAHKPLIYSGYFSDASQEDINTMLEAVRYVEKLVETKAFKKHKAEIVKLDLPACNHLEFQSDDYWKCSLRHLCTTLYHPAGTCSMGPQNDGTAVVDPRLRVHGIKNLRVADASIMPNVISSNTNGAAMMIGHKAGVTILEDWEGIHDEL